MRHPKKTTLSTLRKKRILDFIRSHISEYGYSPTIREIGIDLQRQEGNVVPVSNSVVHYYLGQLEDMGLIEGHRQKKARSISLVEDVLTLSDAHDYLSEIIRIPIIGKLNAKLPIPTRATK